MSMCGAAQDYVCCCARQNETANEKLSTDVPSSVVGVADDGMRSSIGGIENKVEESLTQPQIYPIEKKEEEKGEKEKGKEEEKVEVGEDNDEEDLTQPQDVPKMEEEKKECECDSTEDDIIFPDADPIETETTTNSVEFILSKTSDGNLELSRGSPANTCVISSLTSCVDWDVFLFEYILVPIMFEDEVDFAVVTKDIAGTVIIRVSSSSRNRFEGFVGKLRSFLFQNFLKFKGDSIFRCIDSNIDGDDGISKDSAKVIQELVKASLTKQLICTHSEPVLPKQERVNCFGFKNTAHSCHLNSILQVCFFVCLLAKMKYADSIVVVEGLVVHSVFLCIVGGPNL